MPGAGRADAVLVFANEPRRLLLIETKLFPNGTDGVDQLIRYGQWLGEHHPEWDVAGCLVAQEFSLEVLRECERWRISPCHLAWSPDGGSLLLTGLNDDGSPAT